MDKESTTPTRSQLEALIKQAEYVERLGQRLVPPIVAADRSRRGRANYWKSLNRGLKGLEMMERSTWSELVKLRKLIDSTKPMLNSDLEFIRVWAEANMRIYSRRCRQLASRVCELNRDIAIVSRRIATGEW
jgi:hypothetical protein